MMIQDKFKKLESKYKKLLSQTSKLLYKRNKLEKSNKNLYRSVKYLKTLYNQYFLKETRVSLIFFEIIFTCQFKIILIESITFEC